MKGDALSEAATAGVASAISKLTTYPFDLLKTKMATAEKQQSLVEAASNIVSKDGVGGLYKGSGPRVFKSVTGKVLYYYIYRTLTDAVIGNESRNLTALENVVVGYFSEVLELPVIMPLDAVATRTQLSKTPTTFLQVAKQLYKENRLFVSWEAYVLGAMQPALQNTIFDQLKARVNRSLSALESFVLGMIAASISITITYPLDFARTVSQAMSKSVTQQQVSTTTTKTSRKHLSVVIVHNNNNYGGKTEEDSSSSSVEYFKIAEKHGLIHVSSRDLITTLKQSDCKMGERARKELEANGKVSDDLVMEFTYDRLSKHKVEDGKRGFLLEGFPQSLLLEKDNKKMLMADDDREDAGKQLNNTTRLLLVNSQEEDEEQTIKTTSVQTKRVGVLDILKNTVKAEGPAGIFKGLSANLVQGVLSAALMLMIKEKIALVVVRVIQRIRALIMALVSRGK